MQPFDLLRRFATIRTRVGRASDTRQLISS